MVTAGSVATGFIILALGGAIGYGIKDARGNIEKYKKAYNIGVKTMKDGISYLKKNITS